MGISAALGAGELGKGWFDAIATSDGEIDELHWRTNADRREAQIRAKLGYGPKS